MRLRLTPACANGYNGATGAWMPGSEKDVEEPEATRLLGSYPGWFEAVDAPAPAPDPLRESPSVAGRMIKPGRARGK